MINYIYQLVRPGSISIKYANEDTSVQCGKVIIRPTYMALCQADQRYYQGKRDIKALKKKLPMALIHECCGEVLYDTTNTYKKGQKAVLIPNIPPKIKVAGVYENYAKGCAFRSSGFDGFMREIVCIPPDRVVPFSKIDMSIASICEFVSVAVHAITRFKSDMSVKVNKIGVWGDGSLAYVVCCCLKKMLPDCKIYVIGKNSNKLSQFMFVDGTYLADDIPSDFQIDGAFECAGGEGSFYAIDDIIRFSNPQSRVMLLGVSENKISVNTRNILEKGLTFVGCSRSGREDFQNAVKLMENLDFQKRLGNIITVDKEVKNIKDIHRVFSTDLNTPFKTVFKWNV